MNYVLFTGTEEVQDDFEGAYEEERSLMVAIEEAESRGRYCLAYALEHPHYTSA